MAYVGVHGLTALACAFEHAHFTARKAVVHVNMQLRSRHINVILHTHPHATLERISFQSGFYNPDKKSYNEKQIH